MTHHEVGVELYTTMTKRKMTKGQTTESINVLISNSIMIHLQCRIFNHHLTPRTTYTRFLSCKAHDILSVGILCLVIISQVQNQNNEKWKTKADASSTAKRFESHTWLFFISKC